MAKKEEKLPDSELEPEQEIYRVSWPSLKWQDLASRKDLPVLPKDDQVNQADCKRLKQRASLNSNSKVFLDLNKGDIPPNFMQK